MTGWSAWRRLAWPLAGVAWLWFDLFDDALVTIFPDLGVTAGFAILAVATAVVARVLALPGHATVGRRVEAGLLVLLVAACVTVVELYHVAASSLFAIVWLSLLRLAPRFGLVFIALTLIGDAGLYYFGLVLFVVGMLLVPGSLAGYFREIAPGRIGSVP